MLRLFPLVVGFCVAFNAVHSETLLRPRPLASALSAAQSENWSRAYDLAARAGGDIADDLVTWTRLRAGQGAPEEILAFLIRRDDWPGLKLLRRRSEEGVAAGSAAQILNFFATDAAQTGEGLLAHAAALRGAGQSGEAELALVLGWRTLSLSNEAHSALVATYPKLLAPHHLARLDMVLWRGATAEVAQMLPLVPEPWRQLAAARLGLRSQQRDVDALIAAVPAELQADPGLAYERFRWRLAKGRRDEAIALLVQQSQAHALGEPERWARARRDLARLQMRAGAAKEAYQIATEHGLSEGSNYADLEWLAGFLALRFLNEAELARDHFQRFRAAVFTPISLGRAGYWLGRAQEALGEVEGAAQAYGEGAQYQTSFYGLLAAERVGMGFEATPAPPKPSQQQARADFTQSSVFQAGILLENEGQTDLAERFFRQLVESLPELDLIELGQVLIEKNRPHLAVMVGKQAAQQGVTIPDPYYALHPLVEMNLPVPTELSLAIARRESEFDPGVVSGAGAQGLMQLMPATAKQVAASLDLEHDPAEVLNNWSYNVTLGSAYLAQMAERFEGNVVMVAAAYNAGPSRPDRWIKDNGDPRTGAIDIVDWIELIPFNETRNYVMRVTESLPVYRARLGRPPLPVPFSTELSGSTILPLSP